MLIPQMNIGCPYQSSLSLLIALFMSDYDTCVLFKDSRSNENINFDDLVYSLIFGNEKSIITLSMLDDTGSDQLHQINKNHLNIHLLSYVDSNVTDHLNRIYSQSNQYNVWNLIFIHDSKGVNLIDNFISKQSYIIVSTTLVMVDYDLHIRNQTNNSWKQITIINNSLSIQKEMFEKRINLGGEELIVSFTTHPLTNFLYRVLKQPLFIGSDAFIGVEIYEHINAQPVYTNFLVENLRRLRQFEIIGTRKEVKEQIEMHRPSIALIHPYLSLIFDLSKLDKIWINLNSVISREPDINMSPAFPKNTDEMDFLYPHDRECIKLIVPRSNPAFSFISRVLTSNEALVFGISLVTFWIVRLIVLKSPINEWPALLIETYGFYFAQLSITPKNLGEKLLLLAIMITSIQISSLLSGVFFDNILDNEKRKSINTVGDLLKSDLKIVMLRDHFNSTLMEGWLSQVSPQLLNRTIFVDMKTFLKICGAQTSEYACGLAENVASYMNLVQQNSYNHHYLLRENLYCSQTSFHIKHNSPMTQKVNDVIQGMLENGIAGEYYKRTLHAFMRNIQYKVSTEMELSESLRLWHIFGALYIYTGGILIDILVFLIEKITIRVARLNSTSTKIAPKITKMNQIYFTGKLIANPPGVNEEINQLVNLSPEPSEYHDERSFSILAACGVDRKCSECETETRISVVIEREHEMKVVESQTRKESLGLADGRD